MYLQEMPELCVCGNSRAGGRANSESAPTKLESPPQPPFTPLPELERRPMKGE